MKLATFNSFGKISISKIAISKVAAVSVLECVGVVGLVSQRSFFKGNAITTAHKGVVVTSSNGNLILLKLDDLSQITE